MKIMSGKDSLLRDHLLTQHPIPPPAICYLFAVRLFLIGCVNKKAFVILSPSDEDGRRTSTYSMCKRSRPNSLAHSADDLLLPLMDSLLHSYPLPKTTN